MVSKAHLSCDYQRGPERKLCDNEFGQEACEAVAKATHDGQQVVVETRPASECRKKHWPIWCGLDVRRSYLKYWKSRRLTGLTGLQSRVPELPIAAEPPALAAEVDTSQLPRWQPTGCCSWKLSDLATKSGFSVEELYGKGRKGKTSEVKFRHLKDPSLTWTGRGRKPGWLNEAVKKGAKLESFAI